MTSRLVALCQASAHRVEILSAHAASSERQSSNKFLARSNHFCRNAYFPALALSTLSPRCDIANHVDNCKKETMKSDDSI